MNIIRNRIIAENAIELRMYQTDTMNVISIVGRCALVCRRYMVLKGEKAADVCVCVVGTTKSESFVFAVSVLNA